MTVTCIPQKTTVSLWFCRTAAGRIEKDKKESAVTFSSGKISVVVRSFDAAKVKEDKFTFPKELKDVEDSLKDSETVYGVEEFAYEEKDGIQTAAYELIPDKNEKDALYGMNFVVMNENEDGFEVTAAVPDEASLEVVQKIVILSITVRLKKRTQGKQKPKPPARLKPKPRQPARPKQKLRRKLPAKPRQKPHLKQKL